MNNIRHPSQPYRQVAAENLSDVPLIDLLHMLYVIPQLDAAKKKLAEDKDPPPGVA